MDLSIVIVNYNVKHFLEQCLFSVFKSKINFAMEVFVVDNNSVDGSCQMVRSKFKEAKVIENKDNRGFSKANNQAIELSKGKYVLLLNPDTFLQEDTLQKCFDFMEQNKNAGGLGIKMIDGKGNFLPESKRALPTPLVAFFKIFGLSSLFPKSKLFGKYHLGYLNKDANHKIEILAGAYMWLRKSVLDEIGLLDETFFMYGEDIDLSYRIVKAGYDNYYFADSAIIHYKGESTKKGSINYVMVFYNAMIIFAKKHFTRKNAQLYSFLINFAIYIRAAIGISKRVLQSIFEPVLDFAAIFTGYYFLSPLWESFRFGNPDYYPPEYTWLVVPSYALTWMFFLYFLGAYEKKIKLINILRGIITGSATILLIYALLPETLRFSRVLIVTGTLWSFSTVVLIRLLGGALFMDNRKLLFRHQSKKIVIVGGIKETKRVHDIMKDSALTFEYIGRIALGEERLSDDVLGALDQLEDIVKVNKIDEIVFCSKDLAASQIIETMLLTTTSATDFKIAPPESISVIGSNSIDTAGDLYVVDINSLSKGMNKRKKRMFDILSGLLLLLVAPVLVFIVKDALNYLLNAAKVIVGKYTWVGLSFDDEQAAPHTLYKNGVLTPVDGLKKKDVPDKIKSRVNIMYAKDYKITNDLSIVLKSIKVLGRKI